MSYRSRSAAINVLLAPFEILTTHVQWHSRTALTCGPCHRFPNWRILLDDWPPELDQADSLRICWRRRHDDDATHAPGTRDDTGRHWTACHLPIETTGHPGGVDGAQIRLNPTCPSCMESVT